MFEFGCSDSSATRTGQPDSASTSEVSKVAKKPAAPALTLNENDLPQDAQDESTEETESGVLGKASKLFEKAKSKTGESASGASQWVQDKIGGAADAGSQTADDTWKWANETFDSLKAQGLTTATDTSEWLGQDWNNMESWQYKVITLAGTDEELTEQLNAIGKNGWECFNTEAKNEGTFRFYLKKPTFSYLRQLPFKDVIKLVPMMNNGDK